VVPDIFQNSSKTVVCVCDMLSVDGDADAAVENRIRIGWNKFRQLVPLLTNKNIVESEREIVQWLCVK